jgi:hypothetical protein
MISMRELFLAHRQHILSITISILHLGVIILNVLYAMHCQIFRQLFYDTFGVTPKIEVAKHKVRSNVVVNVPMESFQGVDKCFSSAFTINRGCFFHTLEIGSIVE